MITNIDISEKEYNYISSIVHNLCGINLHDGKKELVRARLAKRLRELGLSSFKQYIKFVEDDPTKVEFSNMVDALSTNLTSFFREEKHFNYLREVVIPEWSSDKTNSTIKIWNTNTWKCLQNLKGNLVAFSPDKTLLASDSLDRTIKIWDTRTLQCLHTLEAHTKMVTSLAFSPDGTKLASASLDRTVKIWDLINLNTL